MKEIILNNIEWLNDYSVKYLEYIFINDGRIWNIRKSKWKKTHISKEDKVLTYLPDLNNNFYKINVKELIQWVFNFDPLKINCNSKSIEKVSINPFQIGDVVYLKNYLINNEPLQHPYLIIANNKHSLKDWRYILISLSSNIGASKVVMSNKIKKLNNSTIIFKPLETSGLLKESMVRLTPKNCVNNVPHTELIYKCKVYNKAKITRAKNIYKQILKKETKDWNQIKKIERKGNEENE